MPLCNTQMRLEIVTSFNVQSLVPTTHVIWLKCCPLFLLTWWGCILPSCFMEPTLSKSEKKTHFAVLPYILPPALLMASGAWYDHKWCRDLHFLTVSSHPVSLSHSHTLPFFPSFPTIAPTWPACPRYYLSLSEQNINPWELPVSLTFLLNIFILKDAKII